MNEQPPAEAVVHEWMWKTPAMTRVTVAVLRLALACGQSGTDFSANDLPEDLEHGGQGIAGSVFKWLKKDGIIENVMIGAQPKFVYNAGSNPVKVYRLKSEILALELLSRHEARPEPEPVATVQTEML